MSKEKTLTPEQIAEEKKLNEVHTKIQPILDEAGIEISAVIQQLPDNPGLYVAQPYYRLKVEKKDDKPAK